MNIDREQYSFDNYNPELYFTECGRERCMPGHSYGPARREYYLIHFIVGGEGVFSDKNTKYSLKQGQGFVIFPGDKNLYSADQKNPWHYYWVGFDGEKAAQLLKECGISKENPIIDGKQADIMQRYIKALFHMSKRTNFNMYILTGYLYLFLSCINTRQTGTLTTGERYVEAAKEYIRNNYTSGITVEGLAGHLHLNRSYLFKLFIQYTGMPPQKFITKYKLGAACELLSCSNHSVSMIAQHLSFASDSAFCRAFKGEYGVTPLSYKRKKPAAPI